MSISWICRTYRSTTNISLWSYKHISGQTFKYLRLVLSLTITSKEGCYLNLHMISQTTLMNKVIGIPSVDENIYFMST
jgi:hypothetical protein